MNTAFALIFIFLVVAIFVCLFAVLSMSSEKFKREHPYAGKRHVIIADTGNGINEKFIIHLRDKEIAIRLGLALNGINRSYYNNNTFMYYVLDDNKWHGRMMFQYNFHKCNNIEEVMEEIKIVDLHTATFAGGNAPNLASGITSQMLNIIEQQWDD